MQNMQTFIWGRPTQVVDERQYYEGFNLNGTDYRLGDTVMLYAESEQQQNYVGRLEAAFCSLAPGSSADPYCVQLKWYERLTNLESRSQCCPGKERELAELEEMDINPIGCISGKCTVLHTRSYEEALQLAGQVCDGPWFFCRGVYHPDTKQVVPRSQGGGLLSLARLHDGVKRRKAGAAVEDVGDSEDMRCSKRPQRGRSGSPLRNVQSSLESSVPLDSLTSEGETQRPSARGRKTSMAAPVGSTADAKGIVGNGSNNSSATSTNPPARCCVECGATHTPQWREGPMGPKTLCNACGVRYGRQQNRAGKRIGGAGVSRAAAMRAAPAVAASGAGGHAKPSAFKGTKCEKESAAQYELATAASSGVRPVRQAAMLAANRNAEFARTGMYPDTEDARANSSSLVRQPSRRADTGVAMEELQPLSPQQQQVLAGVAMSRAASQHQQEAQQHADSVLCQQAAQQPMPPAMLHPLPGPAQATTPPAAPILAPLGKAASMGKAAGRLPASMSAAAAELRMMPRDSPNNSDDSAQDVLGVLDDAMGEQQQQQLLEQWYGPEAQQMFPNSAAGAFTGGRPNFMDAQLAMPLGAHATGMSRSGSKARAAEQSKIAAVIGHSGADAAAVLALKPTGGRVSVNSGGGGGVGLLQCKQESAEHHAVASRKMAAAAHQEGAQPAAQDGSCGAAAAAAAPVDLQQLVQRATRWVPNSMQQDTSTLLSSFELLRHRLLPHEVARLLSVGQAVETAANKAVQADAALAAVREVLQHHQGVADKAHAEATSAVSQLRSMMAQLMAHHPELGIPAPASADGMQSGAAQGPAAPHPDLLLSDIAVGDMDGIDSLALLQPSGSEPDLCGVAARVAAAGAGLRGMGADDDDDMILGGLMMGPAAFPHQAHVAQWQQ